ncbi:hypothetical protein DAPPUDRAFT_249266 [Daphnia pulex]|uniref:Uncharacterized protein n=1 Tax=Daphnia pulex TaxID=6669 RepID=E9GWA5_DAPPU|nr:hypothetical protein DAPPUDRAFT_249266 [Daphnia pulex]|eukprot:EFX76076.1 hypothetical protein DAPPUDRAFT_249266 [Daphnia pulex]
MQDMGHTGSELERLGMGTNQGCSSGGGGTFEASPMGFQPDFNVTWARAIKDYAHQIIELARCGGFVPEIRAIRRPSRRG